MSTLGINFRHVYQKRGFLFGMLTYFLFAFFMDFALMVQRDGRVAVYYASAMVWVFFFGSMIAALSVEVLAKPFAYCMPGHRPIVRKFLMISGIVLSAAWSLKGLAMAMWREPNLSVATLVVPSVSAFWLYTVFYWCGVWLTMRAKSWTVSIAFFPLVMLLNNVLYIFDTLEYVIFHYPALSIIAGFAVNYVVWVRLDGGSMAREYCGKLRVGAFDEWNVDKMQRVRKERLANASESATKKLMVAPAVERFFMAKILACEPGSMSQFVWGGLYRVFGMAATQYLNEMIRFLMIMVPIICLLCYIPGDTGRIVFIMPGLMFVNMDLQVRSTMMPIASRRQRFQAGLMSAIVCCAATVLLLIVMTEWTVPAASFMPAIKYSGHEWPFTGMQIQYVSASFILIPPAMALGLLLPKKPFWRFLIMMVLFQIAIFGILVMGVFKPGLGLVIGPLSVAVMTIISWVIFVAVLSQVCKKMNLVK